MSSRFSAFPPDTLRLMVAVADALGDLLGDRKWVQADLARVLGWPVQTVSELMQAKRRLDPGMALDLAQLTPQRSAEDWLALQAAQDIQDALRKAGQAQRLEAIAVRASAEDLVPVRELVRHGHLPLADPATQYAAARELLGDDPTFGASAKRSQTAVPFTRIQKAWIALARRRAGDVTVSDYDERAFGELARTLAHGVFTPEDFRDLPALFAASGVALVHVKPLTGGRIDGVSLSLGDHPMIAVSGRGKRLDKVLFALLHECAHVVSGHWRAGPRVHEGKDEQVVGDQQTEDQVSDLAASWAFPDGVKVTGMVTRATIAELADNHQVAPAVVVGHLQHEQVLEWSSVLGRSLPSVEEALMSWG